MLLRPASSVANLSFAKTSSDSPSFAKPEVLARGDT